MRLHLRGCSEGDPCKPSPGAKKFWGACSRPHAPLHARFFPHRSFRRRTPPAGTNAHRVHRKERNG
nr:MAG TPA: hypothetical protein [Caudoviricetes sp.]